MRKKSSRPRRQEKIVCGTRLENSAPPASVAFPIVGIDASAGGLEALEQFLGHVPAGSGLALVIIQHLDPTRKGIMPELLQRATKMKVIQVKDRTTVQPDCVYVIPPNQDMSILHGVLHLLKPAATRDELEVTVEKYTDLYDFAPVGYFSLDESGWINEVNLTGAALLGVERDRLINQSLRRFVAAAGQAEFLNFVKKVFAETGRRVCKVGLKKADGGEFWARLTGIAGSTASVPKKCCRVAVSDITILKRAEEAQERLAAIVAFSDDAIIGKNLDSVITSWNRGAEKIFGYTAAEMVGTSILRLIPADRQGEEHQILAKIRRGKSVQHYETLRQTKDGRLIDVSVTVSPIKDSAGKIIGVSKTARDIGDRKRSAEILRRNQALFAALIKQAPVGVYVVDSQFCLHQMNPRARPVFRNVRPLLGRDFSEVMQIVWPKKVAAEIVGHFRHTLATGQPYFSSDFSERRHDIAVTEFYEWQLQRILLPDGKHGVACFFDNITERKLAEEIQRRLDGLSASNRKLEAEIVRRQAGEESLKRSEQHHRQLLEQLRQLSRQILSAQEDERKRISRELHDVIAQTLTGINLQLAALAKGATLNAKGLDRSIARTQKLVEKSVEIVHEFARELRPAVLDDLGLIPALHSFVNIFSQRTGIRVELKAVAGVEQLDIAKRTVLFRVAQEALTNVARHANASRVVVSLQKIAAGIGMKIKDDGKSFDVERVLGGTGSKRLGLLGMRERVEMVGGTFGVASAPGQGTTVQVEIPLGKTSKLARQQKFL